jgi:serine/threonine protein phosphatase PrpC
MNVGTTACVLLIT